MYMYVKSFLVNAKKKKKVSAYIQSVNIGKP